MINHEALVRTANELGPLPQSVTRLSALFSDPDYEMRDVVSTIELDASLGGKLLKLANSAVYPGKSVSSLGEAVMRLGSGTVRSVAVAARARPKADADLSFFDLTPESYWQHSVAVVSFAEEMAKSCRGRFGHDFSTAALLHDFGKLVLSRHVNAEECCQLKAPDLSPVDREMELLSVTHAETGAVVAQSWKLDDELVRAIQYHHCPRLNRSALCHGVNVANQLAWRLESREREYDRESEARAASLDILEITDEQLESIFERGNARLAETLQVFA